jgi:hypothetical protein
MGHLMPRTVTVFVPKGATHRYFTRDHLVTEFDDALDDAYGQALISREFKALRPDDYADELEIFARREYHRLEMPWEIFRAGTSGAHEWISAALRARRRPVHPIES